MKKILLWLLLICFFISGCNNNNYVDKKVLVINARKSVVWNKIIDFVGMSGYSITYANEKKGEMRIVTYSESRSNVKSSYSNGSYTSLGTSRQHELELLIYCWQENRNVFLAVMSPSLNRNNAAIIKYLIENIQLEYEIRIVEEIK